MRDVGKDVRRRGAQVLASKVQKDFLNGWLLDHQEAFIETMDLIQELNPVKFSELYLKAYQLGVGSQSNTNINITLGRQQDRDRLQALVNTRVTPLPSSYTSFEEVKPKELEVKEIEKEQD